MALAMARLPVRGGLLGLGSPRVPASDGSWIVPRKKSENSKSCEARAGHCLLLGRAWSVHSPPSDFAKRQCASSLSTHSEGVGVVGVVRVGWVVGVGGWLGGWVSGWVVVVGEEDCAGNDD